MVRLVMFGSCIKNHTILSLSMLWLALQGCTTLNETQRHQNLRDGLYNATVIYHNPKTDFTAVYELKVGISGGKIIHIYF